MENLFPHFVGIKPTLHNHALSCQAESQGLVSKAVGPTAVTAWKERQKSSSGEVGMIHDGISWDLVLVGGLIPYVRRDHHPIWIYVYVYIYMDDNQNMKRPSTY